MATLPTGNQSLRGVGPRAPRRISPEIFDVNVEELIAASNMPRRIIDDVENLDTRQRERDIQKSTFQQRKDAAIMRADQDRIAAERAGIRQPTIEDTTDLTIQSGEIQAGVDLESLQATRDLLVRQKKFAAANEIDEEINKAVKLKNEQTRLSGTPSTVITETEEGEFVEELVDMPTGEAERVGIKQTKTPQQIQREQENQEFQRQQRELQMENTQSMIDARRIAGERQGARVDIRDNRGRMQQTVSRTIMILDDTGVIGAREVDLQGNYIGPGTGVMADEEAEDLGDGGGIEMPGGEVVTPVSGQGPGAAPAPAPGTARRSTAQPPPAGTEPVFEWGYEFVPNGPPQGGYDRGRRYQHPFLGLRLYLGGDIFDVNNWIAVDGSADDGTA